MVFANVLCEMILAFKAMPSAIFLAVLTWVALRIAVMASLVPVVGVEARKRPLTACGLADKRGMARNRSVKCYLGIGPADKSAFITLKDSWMCSSHMLSEVPTPETVQVCAA